MSCDKNPTNVDDYESYRWNISTPSEQGLDATILARAYQEASDKGFIHGLIVFKNGYLVAEQYFNGYGRGDAHNVHSVCKSFISAMLGIAFELGHLDSLDQPMMDFFPEYDTPDLDPRKRDITIRHLISMHAGFASDTEVYAEVYASANWVRTTINLPLVSNPGESFAYNTFETHLLSAILTKATGMSTLAFAREHLLEPLGIVCHGWQRDLQGYYFGGNNADYTPRDIARLGHLYLRGGKLGDRQIVPQDWAERSLRDYVRKPNWEWGELREVGYGWLWWLGEINEYEVFTALGYGGQFVLCVPELDMVVVSASYSDLWYEQADRQEREVLDIVAEHILPAVIDKR